MPVTLARASIAQPEQGDPWLTPRWFNSAYS